MQITRAFVQVGIFAGYDVVPNELLPECEKYWGHRNDPSEIAKSVCLLMWSGKSSYRANIPYTEFKSAFPSLYPRIKGHIEAMEGLSAS